MATSKFWCILVLVWLTTNVCHSQGFDKQVPPEALSIVLQHASKNAEIYLREKGDLNGDGLDDWAIAAIPLGANGEREEIQFFILIGRKGSTYELLYHFDGIPVLMRGSHINDVSITGEELTVDSFGHTCCEIESNKNVFKLRSGRLILIKTLIEIFHMPNDDGTESRPMEYIEIDYIKKLKTSRIESEKDKSLNRTAVTKFQVDRLKKINESYPFK